MSNTANVTSKTVNTVSKICELVVGLATAITTGYSQVTIAQAERGYWDSATSLNNTQIDLAINSLEEQEKAKELNKKITSINGKIKNGLALTEDEYMFMINNGYVLNEYKLNDNGTATKVINDSSDISNSLKLTGLSTKGYIALGGIILFGIILIKRILK